MVRPRSWGLLVFRRAEHRRGSIRRQNPRYVSPGLRAMRRRPRQMHARPVSREAGGA